LYEAMETSAPESAFADEADSIDRAEADETLYTRNGDDNSGIMSS
jgi:hypothetical protein